MRVVVVGGGVAGVSAALAASSRGAATTLFDPRKAGASKALLPQLISDPWVREDALVMAERLAEAGVELRAERVSAVAHEAKRILVGPPGHQEGSLAYDSLVICTGASSQAPQVKGVSKQGVFVLNEPADYLRLSASLDGLSRVAVSGPVPLALKLGELVAARGPKVEVFCGKGGLDRQFSRPVADVLRRAASLSVVEGALESVLGVERAEAVVSGGSIHACDGVVIAPTSSPSYPAVDCQKGRGGGLLVDSSMRTSLPRVFAAGDAAEMRWRSGSVPARLFSTSLAGGEVAGANAAGGRELAAPSWAVEQTYFGLETCSAGLGEEDALAMGLDVGVASTVSGDGRGKDVVVSMVYDASTHQVYGLKAAGWRASSLSSAASIIVSLGLHAEQLVHLESPYSPGRTYESSPIGLTASKIASGMRRLEAPSLGL